MYHGIIVFKSQPHAATVGRSAGKGSSVHYLDRVPHADPGLGKAQTHVRQDLLGCGPPEAGRLLRRWLVVLRSYEA